MSWRLFFFPVEFNSHYCAILHRSSSDGICGLVAFCHVFHRGSVPHNIANGSYEFKLAIPIRLNSVRTVLYHLQEEPT